MAGPDNLLGRSGVTTSWLLKLRTPASLTAAFVVTSIAFILIAVVYQRAASRLEDNERSVAHTQEVLGRIERLLSTAKDAETGQRGYLLTGDEAYLEPYRTAEATIGSQITNLRQLVADNPSQVRRAELAAELVGARFAILARALELRRASGEQAARSLVLSGTGKESMDRLRAAVGEMEAEERRLLEIRRRNTEVSHRQADFALWTATLAGLGLVTFAFWMIRRHLAALAREREADRAVGVERARLQGIISSAMDAIISVDEEQKIVLFNSSAEKIFGCKAEQALGQSLDQFIPERYRKRHRSDVRTFGESGVTTRSMHSPGVLTGLRASGEEFPIEATISHIQVGDQKLYTVILRDITDRKRTEEQLQQAQKMDAIGRLAGGVAHDFNNLLNIILGYSEMLATALTGDEERKHWVDQIATSANTGALLTKQLLAFSRKQTIAPQYLDLARTVANLEPMLRRLLREDIELNVAVSDRPCSVKVDPGQIEQVLLNLVVNARDAMPEGGRISIEVREVELDKAYVERHQNVTPGKYVMLAVADTGIGMEPEVASRIFEPFFTTKPVGKGTGLGLATVFGIAKQNGGDVWAYSEPDVGTIFKVYLPWAAAVVEAPVGVKTSVSTLRGTETLLLVEDSLGLRELTREVLVRAGYEILEAEDGVDALRVANEHAGNIDLLLTDIVMPRMRGTELAERIRAQRPNLGIVFMSGYTEESLSRTEGPVKILEKPYTSDALLRTVREVLDRMQLQMEDAS